MTRRYLFLSDSIGAANGANFVVRTVDRLRSEPTAEIQFCNSSVPSSNVFDLLDRVQELLPDESFDTAVIFVGINDSKIFAYLDKPLVTKELFAEKLDDLVRRLAIANCRVVLCGLPRLRFEHIAESGVLDGRWHWDEHEYMRYNEVIRGVAEAEPDQRDYVDLEDAFNRSAGGDCAELFQADGVHPSLAGHAVMADAILAQLGFVKS